MSDLGAPTSQPFIDSCIARLENVSTRLDEVNGKLYRICSKVGIDLTDSTKELAEADTPTPSNSKQSLDYLITGIAQASDKCLSMLDDLSSDFTGEN